MERHLDLLNPNHAYLFGFVQGDGSLYRHKDNPNKGKLAVELNIRDEDILHKFHVMFPFGSISYRHRKTNFSDGFDSVTWRICRQSFREEIELLGVPAAKKSDIVQPPTVPYAERDYWRGFIEADGSLGTTKTGIPYISLVTTSDTMARAFEAVILRITGCEKHTNRNARDRAYNIMITNERAVVFAHWLYDNAEIAMNRKRNKANSVMSWVRPVGMKMRSQENWTPEQDRVVLTERPKVAMEILGRTASSVRNRREKLRRKARFVIKDNEGTAEGSA